jgi:hypothetical protein
MSAYATLDEFKAYSPQLFFSDPDMESALEQASRDIDRVVGAIQRSATAPAGLKYDITTLDADSATGLSNATCAQAEFRLLQGPEFFIMPGTETKGPDFTIKSGGGLGVLRWLAPKALDELRSYGLIRTTARARP